jgi:hypothetical protein
MSYGERYKEKPPTTLLDHLRVILENSHNAYMLSYRCRGLQIVIEIQDNTTVAYFADDRNGQVPLDTSEPPFDRIRFFYRQ